jgi:hypothetical protein
MRAVYPLRVYAGLALVSILSLVAALNYYGASTQYFRATGDRYHMSAQLERFAPLLPLMPPGENAGYISDLPSSDFAGKTMFLSAQYALAPRILLQEPSSQKTGAVVGVFSKPQDYAGAGSAMGLTLVKDVGNGVVLYRRK